MQAIFEPIFEILYLLIVLILGIIMIKRSKGNKMYLLFGIMTVMLVAGDSFHLVPRIIALSTDGLSNHVVSLGIGKLVTSITMTIFYVILYFIWKLKYKVENTSKLTIAVIALSLIRIILCLFPQNAWTSPDAPLMWGIYRNIPFLILGILIIILFAKKIKENSDKEFKFMPLAIALSFIFYTCVLLFADKYPALGMLMIPKTIAYVCIVVMGYKMIVKDRKESK